MVEAASEVAGLDGIGEITGLDGTVIPGVANGVVVWASAGAKRHALSTKISQTFEIGCIF